MSENDFFKPHLTRKEVKLIKLLRIQSEEYQHKIAEDISRIHAEHKKLLENDVSEYKDEERAFWLNTEYYKK